MDYTRQPDKYNFTFIDDFLYTVIDTHRCVKYQNERGKVFAHTGECAESLQNTLQIRRRNKKPSASLGRIPGYVLQNKPIPDVPTEIKQKLKDRLVKKGLYINNMRIIDNYKG